MEAMAARAHVTKPILYRYFGGRAGLSQAIVEHFAAELEGELYSAFVSTNDDLKRLEVSVDAYFQFIERDRNVYRFLVQRAGPEASAAQRVIDNFVHTMGRSVAEVMRGPLERAGRSTIGVDVWGQGIVGLINATGDWWLDHPELTREEVQGQAVTLAWQGILNLGLDTSAPALAPQESAPRP